MNYERGIIGRADGRVNGATLCRASLKTKDL
jgi:hypothetical protein